MTLRVLVADRGAMAVRIARTLREMEIAPLGIYTADDKESYHRRLFVEDSEVSRYDDIRDTISIAIELGADGIHPGSSRLAGDPEFAREVIRKGLVFIGPSPDTLSIMRDKVALKTYAEKLGVPVLPWMMIEKSSDLQSFTSLHGSPVIVRPALGHILYGVEIVWSEKDSSRALSNAKKLAEKLYKDNRVIAELYPTSGKYIEVQLLGDGDNIVHLYDRECIVDHKFVKIGEESPSPSLMSDERAKLYEYASMIASSLRLTNTAVLEFIYSPDRKEFYFIDAFPGLTYEHSSTELVIRKDIVRKQIEISFYSALDLRQKDIMPEGHAIGFKILNIDPLQDKYVNGKINTFNEPSGPGIRAESSISSGCVISGEEPTLLSKLTVWGSDRRTSITRLRRALLDYVIDGVSTNIQLLQLITTRDWFNNATYNVSTIVKDYASLTDKLKEMARIHAVALSAIYEVDEKKLSKLAKKPRSLESILRSERVSSVKRSAWYYYVSLKTMLERRHGSRKTREKPH